MVLRARFSPARYLQLAEAVLSYYRQVAISSDVRSRRIRYEVAFSFIQRRRNLACNSACVTFETSFADYQRTPISVSLFLFLSFSLSVSFSASHPLSLDSVVSLVELGVR